MKKAKEELGKAMLSLANLLLVLFFVNTYLQKEHINPFLALLIIYGIGSIYWVGFYLIKESANE